MTPSCGKKRRTMAPSTSLSFLVLLAGLNFLLSNIVRKWGCIDASFFDGPKMSDNVSLTFFKSRSRRSAQCTFGFRLAVAPAVCPLWLSLRVRLLLVLRCTSLSVSDPVHITGSVAATVIDTDFHAQAGTMGRCVGIGDFFLRFQASFRVSTPTLLEPGRNLIDRVLTSPNFIPPSKRRPLHQLVLISCFSQGLS